MGFLSSASFRWANPYGLILTGDSVTVGYDPDGSVTPYGTLVPLCSARLNVAVSGYRLDQVLSVEVPLIMPYAKDAIVVSQAAINDMLQGDTTGSFYNPLTGVDAAGAFARQQTLVAAIRALSPRAVIGLTCLPVSSGTYYTPNFAAQIAAYNALVRGSGLFDAIADVAAVTIERSSDGLHPDATGQAQMAAAFAPVLASLLV